VIIDCISDLHGFYPELPGGDLLIVAGDWTAHDYFDEVQDFEKEWLRCQKYKKIVLIAGNHDGIAAQCDWMSGRKIDYLCDSGTEFEDFKIWGSPYTPTFSNWHFMADRGEAIKKHWDLIPNNTDILVTHGPPYGVLDVTYDGEHAGCRDLLDAIARVRPELHVFGHIHEGYGMYRPNLGVIDCPGYPIFVNASHVNERHKPINAPRRVIL